MSKEESLKFISEIEKKFELSPTEIKGIVANFHVQMERGLRGEESSLKMLPAYVDVPTGKEKGRFIALDLGGTNFRILQVKLDGRGGARIEKTEKHVIPSAVMTGTGTQLFNFIAQSIYKFLINKKIGLDKERKLGFTFSFPVRQTAIDAGILINWTKGFTASGVTGVNVVKLLKDSLKKYGIENVEIAALANDTVGTLAARAYHDKSCDVGVIFGTGTNACYREQTGRVGKLKNRKLFKSDQMIVNIEWGNFNRLKRNEFDERLDKSTNNPGKQMMEKMISGMYLGELARLIIADMIKKKLLFVNSKTRFSKGNFKTSNMSLIESDKSEKLPKVKDFLENIGILDAGPFEMWQLKRVCRIVSRRAAIISAASLSAVTTWMDPDLRKKHTIGIDGTLYERYPGFRSTIKKVLTKIHGNRAKNIKLVRAKDGSGLGVAVVSAVAAKS